MGKVEVTNKIVLAIKETIKNSVYDGKVYIAGGFVRDLLLGKDSNDIDLLIDGESINEGIKFANWFCVRHNIFKDGSNPVVYGEYGTAMFHFMGEKIECVAPRSEKYKEDSRNPIVSLCPINKECYRRDFTINSMYINVSTDELCDFSGMGINDLKNGIIRATDEPDVIFRDDPLRMLRCIRFACRYHYAIDEYTEYGIFKNRERIQIISQERITEEINKILVSDRASYGLNLIRNTELVRFVLPEFVPTIWLKQNIYHFGDVWLHTMSVVDNSSPILVNRLAALFHDLGKVKTQTFDKDGNVHFYAHEMESERMTDVILRRMKYPNDIIKAVKVIVKNHMRTKSFGDDCSTMKDKSLRKIQYELGDYFDAWLDVVNADNLSHSEEHCMPNQARIIKERSDELVFKGEDAFKINLPINGNDIMDILEIDKGTPVVQDFLKYTIKAYYRNPHITREECLNYIKQLIKSRKNKIEKNEEK
jgi:tRNA nucleotidyltransferase/poly(A) polymerase